MAAQNGTTATGGTRRSGSRAAGGSTPAPATRSRGRTTRPGAGSRSTAAVRPNGSTAAPVATRVVHGDAPLPAGLDRAPGEGRRLLAAHVEAPLLTVDARVATGGIRLQVGPARIGLPGPAVVLVGAAALAASVVELPVVAAGVVGAALAYRRRLRRFVPTLSLFDAAPGAARTRR